MTDRNFYNPPTKNRNDIPNVKFICFLNIKTKECSSRWSLPSGSSGKHLRARATALVPLSLLGNSSCSWSPWVAWSLRILWSPSSPYKLNTIKRTPSTSLGETRVFQFKKNVGARHRFWNPYFGSWTTKKGRTSSGPHRKLIRYPPKKTYPLSFSEVLGGFLY